MELHGPNQEIDEATNIQIQPYSVSPMSIVRVPCQWKDCDCQPLVKPKEKVLRGQAIALVEGVAIHSPVSGLVKEITVQDNCEGIDAETIVIENDGSNESVSPSILGPLENIERNELYSHLQASGIVITYKDRATRIKALPPTDKEIHTILFHGCSLSSGLAEEMTNLLEEAVSGLKVLFLLYPEAGLVWQGEKGSPLGEVLSQFPQAQCFSHRRGIFDLPAHLAMEELLGRHLGEDCPPMEDGLLPITFQQARAIHRAVFLGEPYLEQLILVEGKGIKKPGYYQVPLGVDLGRVLLAAEVDENQLAKVVVGCALNGTSVSRLDLPISKTVSSIITFSKHEVFHYQSRPCIHCGRCYQICPLKLMPQRIAGYGENNNWDLAEEEGALLCNECGRCSYICPAKRPLVQFIKLAKQMILKRQKN